MTRRKLTEMPHMEIGAKSPLPGDSHRFGVVDFQIEKYPMGQAEKAALMRALRTTGVVADSDKGSIFFGPDGKISKATEQQKSKLPHLPDYWEKHMVNVEMDESEEDLHSLIRQLREYTKE